jgi:hypothetical protein
MATKPAPQHRFRRTRVSRFLQARWRFVFAVAVGVTLGLLLPGDHEIASRFLIGFDAGVALYLLLVIVMIVRSDPRAPGIAASGRWPRRHSHSDGGRRHDEPRRHPSLAAIGFGERHH